MKHFRLQWFDERKLRDGNFDDNRMTKVKLMVVNLTRQKDKII